LEGHLSQAIEAIRDPIKDILVEVEAAIDFPEDVDEIIQPEAFVKRMGQDVTGPLEILLEHYNEGHVYREGIAAAIIGCPNVGKSSLMNRLLQKERSIVTAVPGTTRDFIEETVNIKGIPLRLIDTAGLHDTEDALEAAGVRFTRQRLDEADLVLFMVDCNSPISGEDMQIYDLVRNRKTILVINKTDLVDDRIAKTVASRLQGLPWVKISALYDEGIDSLKDTVFREVTSQGGGADVPPVVPNLRHKVKIEKALEASKAALEGLNVRTPAELVAVDLREALDALGEIIGLTTTEDILDQIFSRFCIGK
jgi:tRNA modification GTPase